MYLQKNLLAWHAQDMLFNITLQITFHRKFKISKSTSMLTCNAWQGLGWWKMDGMITELWLYRHHFFVNLIRIIEDIFPIFDSQEDSNQMFMLMVAEINDTCKLYSVQNHLITMCSSALMTWRDDRSTTIHICSLIFMNNCLGCVSNTSHFHLHLLALP